jgi:hypothetical protein
MRWPNQLHPDLSTFHIWWTGIKLILRICENGTLIIPLGPWLCDPKKYINHDSYFNPITNTVIIRGNDDMWKIYHHVTTTFTTLQFRLNDMVSVFNYSLNDFSPCDYVVHDQFISVWRWSIFNSSIPDSPIMGLPIYDDVTVAFNTESLW